MAQHDYNIANQSGADFRSDLNDALSAIASTNSGDTSPATTFANQLWIDTANNLLKIRNEANSAWITTGIDITADNTFTSVVINTSITGTAVLDDDTFGTASATTIATSESIKAYVDSQVGSVDTLSEILANGNATGGNDISFADDDKANFGAGSDLQIFHDGTNSHIREQGTGDLLISASDKVIIRDTTDGAQIAVFDTDGAVSLNYGNATKFDTTSTGISVTGRVSAESIKLDASGSVNPQILLDNEDFGTYNWSIFQGDTGGFAVSAQGSSGAEMALTAGGTDHTDAVLTVAGKTVITAKGGNITSDSLDFSDNVKAIFGTGSDLEIFHDGSTSHVKDVGTGILQLTTNGDAIQLYDSVNNTLIARFNVGGNVTLRYDGETKFVTTANGIDVTGAIETDGVNSSENIKVQREFPQIQLENTVTTGRNATFALRANRADIIAQNDTTNGLITFRGDNGTEETEYARFSSSGAFFVGKTTSSDSIAGIKLTADGSLVATRSEAVPLKLNRQTSTGIIQNFHYDNSTVGNISVTASATAYNTTSDYRLKENIEYDFTAIDRVKDLKPCRFNFIADADTTVDGFIAHEVQDIVPEAISGEKDAVETYIDDEGVEQTRPSYQGIDQSKLVPLLTKAIQEQQAQIESLQAQINELKGE